MTPPWASVLRGLLSHERYTPNSQTPKPAPPCSANLMLHRSFSTESSYPLVFPSITVTHVLVGTILVIRIPAASTRTAFGFVGLAISLN
jgi:hypothetical protein